MLEEDAVVTSVHGEFVEVVTTPRAACGSCQASSACGTSLLARLFPERKRTWRVRNTAGAVNGDAVVIGLDESALQLVAVLVYLLPLAGLIGGAIAGSFFADFYAASFAEPLSITTGLSGMLLALYLVRRFSDRLERSGNCEAKILYVKKHSVVIESVSKREKP